MEKKDKINNGYGKCESKDINSIDCINVNGQCEKCKHFIYIKNN